jgi:signal transduction histidine kinase
MNDAKAATMLARGASRGWVEIALLCASLLVGLSLVLAELTGLDGLCVTSADEIVFVAIVTASSACLVLAQLARGSRALKWPLAALCASFLAFTLYFPISPLSALAAVMYLAIPLSSYLPFPKGAAASAAALGALAALRFIVLPPEALSQKAASFRDVLVFVAAPLFASALVSCLAALRAELARLSSNLVAVTKLNLSYQDYGARVEERLALEERLRLTRDLHDVVGYALTNTIMTLRAASLMSEREPERVGAFLDSARGEVERSLGQVRELLGDMRKREIRGQAGPGAIAKAVRSLRAATGAEIDIDYGSFDWAVEGEAALAIGHFVQEGMLNALTHGGASAIRASFRESGGSLAVSIKDNGGGAAALEEGIGISGMRERIEKLGGKLSYSSSRLGFSIEMSLPLQGRERPA